jgi:hypothetical protein
MRLRTLSGLVLALASEPHTAERAGRSAAGIAYEPRSTGRSQSGALGDPSVCCQQNRSLHLNREGQFAIRRPGLPVCPLDAGISPA